jgi:hypothetical protein
MTALPTGKIARNGARQQGIAFLEEEQAESSFGTCCGAGEGGEEFLFSLGFRAEPD